MKSIRVPAGLLLAALGATLSVLAADAPLQPTELTGDHLDMWTVENDTHAICTGAVTLTGTDLRILCDRLEIIAEGVGDKTATMPALDKFKYLLATGHVHIVQGEREATCGRAEVLPRENKVVLTEEPVVIDHGAGSTTAGDTITLLRGERRVIVDKPRSSFPAIKDLGFDKNKPAAPDNPAPAAQK
jgi:lipopolysaccharide export system protein LptA